MSENNTLLNGRVTDFHITLMVGKVPQPFAYTKNPCVCVSIFVLVLCIDILLLKEK